MNQVISPEIAKEKIENLHKNGKKVVITGGCFDILHPGHFALFENAKKAGDVLFVLLESDEKLTQIKGPNRPIHSQEERATMLKAIRYIDYIIPLPLFSNNEQYDHLLQMLKPDIIATTENDTNLKHKQRQAALINANIVAVTKYIPHKSTSNLANILSKES
ncbi:MAG TPA: adenylyltransferase/cytidyltransferase family protein [Patescibacteria group bacterium]